MPVPRDVANPPERPSDPIPGVLYVDPVRLVGHVIYFAVNRAGDVAYRVMTTRDALTPELYAHFEEGARIACGTTAPPLSLLA